MRYNNYLINKRISFLGTGRMACALINSFINNNIFKPSQIVGTHYNEQRKNELSKNLGVEIITSNCRAVSSSDIIFVCVRPQQIKDLIQEIKTAVTKEKILISIAVGVSINYLENNLYDCKNIIRVHPTSLIMAASHGVSYIYFHPNVKEQNIQLVKYALNHLGELLYIPEEKIDYYAIFAGCLPAFFSSFLRSWRDIAKKEGISEKQIDLIFSAIASGLTKVLIDKDLSLDRFEKLIATPNGLTETGLNALKSGGLDELFNSVLVETKSKIKIIQSMFST